MSDSKLRLVALLTLAGCYAPPSGAHSGSTSSGSGASASGSTAGGSTAGATSSTSGSASTTGGGSTGTPACCSPITTGGTGSSGASSYANGAFETFPIRHFAVSCRDPGDGGCDPSLVHVGFDNGVDWGCGSTRFWVELEAEGSAGSVVGQALPISPDGGEGFATLTHYSVDLSGGSTGQGWPAQGGTLTITSYSPSQNSAPPRFTGTFDADFGPLQSHLVGAFDTANPDPWCRH